ARLARGEVVGVVTDPLLLRGVPLDAGACRIPRLAVEVRGGPVVHDASVERPAPGPAGVEAHAGGIVLSRILDPVSPLRQIAGLRVGPGVDPVAGGRRPIVLQLAEGVEALTGGQVVAVDLP